MNSQMRQQVMFKGEAFLAFSALEGTFGGVQEQVSVQTMLVTEILATMRTYMRSLARM